MFDIKDLRKLPVPYKDVEVFVQEKYKISGDKPGSGNTENIGSFKTNRMEYLVKEKVHFPVWELTYTKIIGLDIRSTEEN